MISQALEERQWREQLRAMRHLPPDTVLPVLTDPDERQLFDELLGLSDDVAPLRWITAERGHLAALIALRQMLRSLGRTAEGAARALAEGRSVPEDESRAGPARVAPGLEPRFAARRRDGARDATALAGGKRSPPTPGPPAAG